MNAQAIQSAEILVRFTNPAEGDRKPWIKSSDGAMYGVEPVDFGRFQPGGRYRIEYVEKEGRGKWQGRTFKNIVKCEPIQSSPATSSANPGPSVASGAPSEFEFVTRILAAYVQCCGVENTVDGLVTRARALREVYGRVWGAQ